MKLTEGNARSESLRGESERRIFDDIIPGFGLRLRAGAHGVRRSYILQYAIGGRQHTLRLGGVGEISCNEARKLAEAARGDIAKAKLGHGIDPSITRAKIKAESQPKPRVGTFATIVANYLEAKQGGKKPLKASTYRETIRHFNEYWKPLHAIAIDDIARVTIATELDVIAKRNGPVAANRARSSLSAFFKWAVETGRCNQNPTIGTIIHDENEARSRTLKDAESAAIYLACPENDYGRIVRLLLLTGCRREEIGSLRWSEIDLDARTITLPKERTKNKREHVVHLSDSAFEIIGAVPRRDREYVFGGGQGGFGGWSKSKALLDEAAQIKEPWRLHDLRRTVATRMADLGVLPHVVEATLNHISGHKAGVAGIYNRSTYIEERKKALDLWAAHLKVVVAQATGANITALRNRGSAAGKKR
jgi:integrase